MKNPGCANNRGSPPYISRNSSYQIPLPPNAPAAMRLKPKTACGDEDGSQSAACVQISTFLSRCLHIREWIEALSTETLRRGLNTKWVNELVDRYKAAMAVATTPEEMKAVHK